MTSLLEGILAAITAILLSAFIVTQFSNSYPAAEARILRRVSAWALLIRYIGAVIINVNVGSSYTFGDLFWGDSYTYDAGGYVLSQTWVGQSFVGPSISVSGYGFQYFVAFVYFIFGRNQLLVQFLNGTISVLAALVIYAIARDLFDPNVARRAFEFMCYFPQMIFWSCAMYKDPSILLCIAMSMYAVLKLRNRVSAPLIVLFVGASLYLMTLRFYVFYMVVFAALGTFIFAQRRGLLSGLAVQVLVVAIFLGAVAFGVKRETIEAQQQFFDLEKLQTARLGQTTQGRSSFGGDIDVSTREGALAAVPIGLVYLLFAPFPWSISGMRQLLTLPETLVWYALMPALLRGLRLTIRTRFRDTLPILVFAGTLTLAYAVFQSNVGTAYRQRTQISMFFFVFMGVGLEAKREEQLRRQQRLPGASPDRTRGRPVLPR